MNQYLKELISLKQNFKLHDGDKASVSALYQFADKLSGIEERDAKEVLVDVYHQLGMMESAFRVFLTVFDKSDRKQIKKFVTLQELSKSRGDHFPLPRPLTEKEKAARKFDATFVQDAEWEGERDKEKDDELFLRTPGYLSWQGEYWLSCCDDYCAYLGTVGTRELKAMDIADEVFEEYYMRDDFFEDVEEYLVKDGSLCGYLFQCLHCGKYHLWVDAD